MVGVGQRRFLEEMAYEKFIKDEWGFARQKKEGKDFVVSLSWGTIKCYNQQIDCTH